MRYWVVLIPLFLQGAQPAKTDASPSRREAAQLAQSPTDRVLHLDSVYASILEKTNAQLSLWWNPFGVMVAALGVLFAVLAIAAAVIIYRQGREYRELINRSIAKYQDILNAFIEDKNKQVELLKENIAAAVANAKSELDGLSGEQKQKVEEYLARLQEYRRL